MYRSYENPTKLEAELERTEKEYTDAKDSEEYRTGDDSIKESIDVYFYEQIADLKDRVRFAWDDDEAVQEGWE